MAKRERLTKIQTNMICDAAKLQKIHDWGMEVSLSGKKGTWSWEVKGVNKGTSPSLKGAVQASFRVARQHVLRDVKAK